MTKENDAPLERERVRRRISTTVRDFVRGRATFNAAELAAHVETMHPGSAPDSAGRILRLLRREGAIAYTVVDRGRSLYRVDAAKGA